MAKRGITGLKYYKPTDDEKGYTVLRVVKKKGDSNYVIFYENNPGVKHIVTRDFLSGFRPIRPHANFGIVFCETGGGKYRLEDVVTLFAKDGMTSDFAICRQNVIDPLYALLGGENKYGMAISRDSIPSNIDYDAFKRHDKFIRSVNLYAYLDDTVDSLLSLIPSIKIQADKILKASYDKFHKDGKGFCKTLKELYENNDLWGLWDSMFGIKSIPGEVQLPSEKNPMCQMDIQQVYALQNAIGYYINDLVIVPYWYDIEFANIRIDFDLVRDSTGKVYLVTYQKGDGITIPENEQALTKEEKEKFLAPKF